MRKSFLDKRIPTLLGLLIIAIGIGVTTHLVNTGVIFTSKASPAQEPKNVKITNITDTTFTVSYSTDDSVFGSLNYGTTPTLGQIALDDRDQVSQATVPHKQHSMTVQNLDSSTTYYFSITSAENKYSNNNSPFQLTTGPPVEATPSAQKPLSGKVITSSGSPPQEAIVYAFLDDSQTVSSLVKNDGSFLLPLNSLRTKDFSSYYNFTDSSVLKLQLVGEGATSNVAVSINQINPVPTITLSNNYDFTVSESPIATSSAVTQPAESFPSPTQEQTSGIEPSISTPSKDEGFTDAQPEFGGTALPNESVEIVIQSPEEIKASVTTDASGNWQYRPTKPLSPGEHTISIITRDANGIIKTIKQSFVVYAEGSQLPNATLSITPTPRPGTPPTPSPTPTPTPSPTPSPSPTLIPTPTIVPSISVIPESSLAASITPSITPAPISDPGSNTAVTAGFIGIFVTLAGAFLFLYAKRTTII